MISLMLEKDNKEKFDLIILGGGAAGLLVGSYLVKKLKILVIDKNTIGRSKHAWTYWSDKTTQYGLDKYVKYKLDNAKAKSFHGSEIRIKLGKLIKFCPVIAEDELLSDKADQMRQSGATLINKCKFLKIEYVDGGVIVHTNKGVFFSKVVIDAMGQGSNLVKDHKLFERAYYYTVYGLAVDEIGLPIGEYDFIETVIDKKPLPFWWSMPMGEKKDFIGSFYLSKKPVNIKIAREDFNLLRNSHEYTRDKSIKTIKEYFGSIPCAVKFKKDGLPRVAFIGDSRGWGTGFGWGFSPIVDNAEKIAKNIEWCLKNNKVSGADLVHATEVKFSDAVKEMNARLEELIVVFLTLANVDQIERIFKIFSARAHLIEKLCLFRLNSEEIYECLKAISQEFSLGEIMRMFSKGDTKFLLHEIVEILKEYGEIKFK